MATKRYVTGGMGSRPGFNSSSLGGGGLTDVDITDPKLDDKLVFDGTHWVNVSSIGTGITTAISFFDPTSALPVAPTRGDRYISLATANGWNDRYIYTYNGLSGSANVAVTTTNTTLKDTRLSLTPDEYIGMVITCNGKTMTVTSNNGNTLTGASWSGGGNPGNGNAWNGVLWLETIPTTGMSVYVQSVYDLYLYQSALWRVCHDYLINPVIAMFDPGSGLPVAPAINDRYISMDFGSGWIKNYVYEWDGARWVQTTPFVGSMVYVKDLDQVYIYDSTNTWVIYPQSWLEPVIEIFDNTAALPVAPSNEDRYIAKVTANGWTKDYVYEWNTLTWVPTIPVTGMQVYNDDTDLPYFYTGAAWVEFAPLTAHALGGPLHSADTIANIKTKVSDGSLITTAAGEINALTAKGTPTTSDLLIIEDAADANNKKKITISNLPAAAPAAHRTTHLQGGSDAFILNGTGAPPSAVGLPDGTLYVKYTP